MADSKMADQADVKSDPDPSGSDSGLDELKRMIAGLSDQVSSQARGLQETVMNSFNDAVEAARLISMEQCKGLRAEMEAQLQEVKEEAVARVDVLREEVSGLRAAVEKQRVAGGEERPVLGWPKDHGHRCPHSDPGDARGWGSPYQPTVTDYLDPPTFGRHQPPTPASITPPRTPTPPPLLQSPVGGGGQPAASFKASGGASGRRKPAEFDGKVAWEAYQAQFELLAQGQGWSNQEMALQLVASLRGPALEILGHLPADQRSSYARVAGAMKQRFGSPYQSEVYRARLKGRVRQPGEPLPQLSLDIETLVRRAYPAASEEMVAVLARDNFLDALQFQKMQMYVKQAHPEDLQAALAQALEYEAFMRSTGGVLTAPEPASPRRRHFQTRRVQTQPVATRKGKAAGPRVFRGACWQCGQVGHRRSECKEGRKTRSLDDLRARSPTSACCWNCGQQGHRRSSCTQPRDMTLVGGNLAGLGAGATAQPPTVEPHRA